MKGFAIWCLGLLTLAFIISAITEENPTWGSRFSYAMFILMSAYPLIYIATLEGS